MRTLAKYIVCFSSFSAVFGIVITFIQSGVYDTLVKKDYVDWNMLFNIITLIIISWLLIVLITIILEFVYIVNKFDNNLIRAKEEYAELSENYNKLNRTKEVEHDYSDLVVYFKLMDKFICENEEIRVKWYNYLRGIDVEKENNKDGESD